MPTVRQNVINKKLTKEEREAFASFGRDKEAIDDIERRLSKPMWTFWADASELYMTLTTGSTIVYEGGKQRTNDESSGCKFTNNYFDTNNREIAKNIFLSDLYFEGRIKEVEDHVADEAQAKYDEFKSAVLSDETNRQRLKEDFAKELEEAKASA
jgi:hypothetical protein